MIAWFFEGLAQEALGDPRRRKPSLRAMLATCDYTAHRLPDLEPLPRRARDDVTEQAIDDDLLDAMVGGGIGPMGL